MKFDESIATGGEEDTREQEVFVEFKTLAEGYQTCRSKGWWFTRGGLG